MGECITFAFPGDEERWSIVDDRQGLQQQVHRRMAPWCCAASQSSLYWPKDACSLFADDARFIFLGEHVWDYISWLPSSPIFVPLHVF